MIESFLRVAYPEYFPPGTLLGPFRNLCEQRIGTSAEILAEADTRELCIIALSTIELPDRRRDRKYPKDAAECISQALYYLRLGNAWIVLRGSDGTPTRPRGTHIDGMRPPTSSQRHNMEPTAWQSLVSQV
jgi:hypothetical protein